ncbi:hypothetical protein [Streptomyces lasiicapitis]|uniref:hypothetical protein n=1 Tax=Streptomyces lasiicapitis TaxID=1923961 RepID=UPI003662D971
MSDATDYDKPRQMRIPDDEWGPFGDAAKAQHPAGRSPRAAVVREFIRWYMRRPGAKLPERPPAGPWSKGQEPAVLSPGSVRLPPETEGRYPPEIIERMNQGQRRPGKEPKP